MEFALGVLKWVPKVFWNSTSVELVIAAEGHAKQFKKPEDDFMSRNELEEMMKRHPDS